MRLLSIVTAAAAAAAAALFAVPAAPAAASVPISGIQEVSARAYGSPHTKVSARAVCPYGTRVISSSAGNAAVASVVPLPDIRTVEAVGEILNSDPGNFLYVSATCIPITAIPGVIGAATFVADGPANQLRTGVAWCPPGYIAFAGGGYFLSSNGGASLNAYNMVSNAPSGNLNGQGWTFGGYTSGNDTMVINTMCAPRQGGFVQQSHVAAPAPGTFAGVYAECGTGYLAIAGGAYLSKPDGSESSGTIFWSTRSGVSSWYASASADSRSVAGTKIVAIANCIPSS